MSADNHGSGGHFVAPISVYVGTFLALLVLTAVTVGVTYFDLGRFNIVIAMAVAVVKASLVVAFFMGLSWDHDRFNIVVFSGGLLFLSLFFILTFPDLLYRDAIDPIKGNPGTNPQAYGFEAPGAGDGHADPKLNPKRLYGATSTTGASTGTSGVLVLESRADYLPGGAQYAK